MRKYSMDALGGLFLEGGGFFDEGIAWEGPTAFCSFPRPTTKRRWLNFAFSFIHGGQMARPSDDSPNSSAPALPAAQVFPQMNTLGAFLLEVLNQHTI